MTHTIDLECGHTATLSDADLDALPDTGCAWCDRCSAEQPEAGGDAPLERLLRELLTLLAEDEDAARYLDVHLPADGLGRVITFDEAGVAKIIAR